MSEMSGLKALVAGLAAACFSSWSTRWRSCSSSSGTFCPRALAAMASAMAHNKMRYMSHSRTWTRLRVEDARRCTVSGAKGRVARVERKERRLADGASGSREIRFVAREKGRRLQRAARHAEHRAEEVVQVAQPIAFRRFRIRADRRLGGMPVLVGERGLLREQHRDDEEKAAQAAEHGGDSSPGLLGDALFEAGDEEILRQLLADEDHERLLLLHFSPHLAHIAAHHHMNALEHHAARVALHPQDAFVAQKIGPVDLDHPGEELLELLPVEGLVGAEHERLDLVVVLVRDVGEEIGIELEDRVQVEAADVEHLADRRVAEMHLLDRRPRIHLADALRELLHLVGGNEIGLRHQDPVCEADLLLRLVELVELLRRVLRVDQRDDGVEQIVVADFLVGEEGLRHRSGIRHAGGLYHHAVELQRALLALFLERAKNADQVAAHGAADAAVVHLDDLLVGFLDDRAIDPDFAELVLDHRDPMTMLLLEDAIEERGLAAAEKAGEDRHRHHLLLLHGPSLPPETRAAFYAGLCAQHQETLEVLAFREF